jgi:hypothetical protein
MVELFYPPLFILVTAPALKFFLYENLGMSKHFYNDNILNYFKLFSLAYICLESLGMLDESLKKRLKICSEISFLR